MTKFKKFAIIPLNTMRNHCEEINKRKKGQKMSKLVFLDDEPDIVEGVIHSLFKDFPEKGWEPSDVLILIPTDDAEDYKARRKMEIKSITEWSGFQVEFLTGDCPVDDILKVLQREEAGVFACDNDMNCSDNEAYRYIGGWEIVQALMSNPELPEWVIGVFSLDYIYERLEGTGMKWWQKQCPHRFPSKGG